MGTYIKAASGNNLNTTAAWLENGVPPATVPDDRDTLFWTASPVLSLGGSLVGGALCGGILMEGASADITWNPTTAGVAITFNTLVNNLTVFFQRRPNNRQWVSGANGQFALGSLDRTFRLFNSTGNLALYFAGNRLTGSGTLTLENGGDPTDSAYLAVFGSNQTLSSFTGNVVLSDRVLVGAGRVGSGMFPNSNMTVNGENCVLIPFDASGDILGAASRTLTINSNNISLGYASRGWSINYVVALGSTKRTLNVLGYTEFDSNVTGSNGFIKTGTGGLVFQAATNSLSGQISINQGYIGLGIFNSGNANVLPSLTNGFDFGSSGSTLAYYGTSAFTENRPITISSGNTNNYVQATLNNTITFGAASLIALFPGTLTLSGDETVTAPVMSFGTNVPVAAASLLGLNYGTTNTTRTYRFTLTPNTPVTMQGFIDLWSSNSVSGHTLDILNNGTEATTFSNAIAVRKRAGASGASSAQAVSFSGSNPATTTLQGNILQDAGQGTLSLVKNFPGRLVLQGTNALSGSLVVSTGVFEAQNAAGLGASAATGVSTSGTGQIHLTAGGTYNKSGTAFTIHASNPIVSIGDNTLQTAGITLGGTTTFEVTTGNRLAIANTSAIADGASTFGITKTGAGELALAAFANTYDGVVTVSAGTLAIGSVDALGVGASAVQLTSTLKYTGAAATLSRALQLNGAAPILEAAGSGALTVTNLSHDAATKTVTLRGSNTGANTITSNLADSSGVLSLVKEDSGKWVLTAGTRTYSGTTAINNGTLRLETANSATTSGAVTIGASGTVELVTSTLANSGATAGEVLGTGNVTCNGGTIKTRGGTTQKGQVRYGGSLTFGPNSVLYVGAAA